MLRLMKMSGNMRKINQCLQLQFVFVEMLFPAIYLLVNFATAKFTRSDFVKKFM